MENVELDEQPGSPWLLARRWSVPWVTVPFAVWFIGWLLLVMPAERRLAESQHALLAAEREELTVSVAAEREQLVIQRLKRRISDILSDSERLRLAEAAANVELTQLEARDAGLAPAQGHWLMPGQQPLIDR